MAGCAGVHTELPWNGQVPSVTMHFPENHITRKQVWGWGWRVVPGFSQDGVTSKWDFNSTWFHAHHCIGCPMLLSATIFTATTTITKQPMCGVCGCGVRL